MNLYKLSILITVIIIIGAIGMHIAQCNQLRNINREYIVKISDLENKLKNQGNKQRLELLNENLILNSKISLLDINNDTINLKSIIKKPTLVFRYSILNCGACVAIELNNIQEVIAKYKTLKDRIILISFYQDLRSEIYAYKSLKIKIPMYIIPNNKLGLPIEENNNSPYYFVLNSDLSVSNLFIPERENIDNSKEYLTMIFDRIVSKFN